VTEGLWFHQWSSSSSATFTGKGPAVPAHLVCAGAQSGSELDPITQLAWWGHTEHTLGPAATGSGSHVRALAPGEGHVLPALPPSLSSQLCPEPDSSIQNVCWFSSPCLYYLS